MIEELRIYRLKAGGLTEYLRLAAEVQVPIRGDRHGLLLGFWHAEVGAANSVFNLWRHQSLYHRQMLRTQLDAIPAWKNDYLAKVWPLMEEQVIRFMDPLVPFEPRRGGKHIYEARFFRTKVGEARRIAEALQHHAPREFRDATAGLWTTTAGHLNEVVHMGAYADPAARIRTSLTHPDWQAFFDEFGAGIAEMSSALLLPAAHSPTQ